MLTTAAMSACGGGNASPPGTWVAEHDTAGDTVVVRTVSGSVWGEPATLRIDQTIGVLEGDSALMLGFIQEIAVDDQGGIYAFDGQVPALRYYDAHGSYVRTLGREGSGPGEYRDVALGLALRSDGRLVMRDPRNARLNVYEPDGTPSDHWPVASGLYTANAMVLDEHDHVFLKVLLRRPERNKAWPIGLLHYDAEGNFVDTIPAPAVLGEPTEAGGVFLPSKVWALGRQGVFAVGVNDRYVFELRFPDGRVTRIERVAAPTPVEPGERAEWEALNAWRRERQRQNLSSDLPPVPTTKPFYKAFSLGERGRVWVHRYARAEQSEVPAGEPDPSRPPPFTWREPGVYDVFDTTGAYLGEVRGPPRSSLRVFRGDTVWGVQLGELDEHYLVRAVVEVGSS